VLPRGESTGLKPVESVHRDLFAARSRPRVQGFRRVILDPPRQGAEAQARALAQSAVPRLIYVLLQSGELRARCAGLLGDGGDRLASVTPVDTIPLLGRMWTCGCI